MIPNDRPVLGADLDDLRYLLGLTTLGACHLLGLDPPKYSLLRNRAQEPLDRPSRALMIRHLEQHPEDSPIPRPPTFRDVLGVLNVLEPGKWSIGRAAILFGAKPGSGFRWNKNESATSPAIDNLFQVFINATRQRGVVALREWVSNVETEARALGVTDMADFWRDGWPEPKRGQDLSALTSSDAGGETAAPAPKRRGRTPGP